MPRTAVISGGGTGIGYAVAERFLSGGDRVIITGRREDLLRASADKLGEGAAYLAADLAEPEGGRRVADFLADQYGGVDIVAACAGGNIEIQAPEKREEGLEGVSWYWTENLRLNVMTAVHLVEAVKPVIADDGRVLLFSSIAAFRGSGTGSYAASKAALHPYAIDLSAQLGERGATANVIAPGYIEATEFFADRMTERRRDTLIAQTHDKRAGTPADVAELAHWLAAPAAGHITAQILQVNGGALAGR
ncbi:SDR family oxidoreductase [Glycomyces sp. L485]|uniref:SDR family NAD(P)-dependent oxidoreductase n=1 Tax=Glycomyces sp. L485 TaxID=2909235 RepID=UPI001F4ACEF2|nr:SDR family oxidoreductase [Glycomyces sp. L485]MCH7232712.1 SDR family oxidoreductase [Glycomyces sp. L485]